MVYPVIWLWLWRKSEEDYLKDCWKIILQLRKQKKTKNKKTKTKNQTTTTKNPLIEALIYMM